MSSFFSQQKSAVYAAAMVTLLGAPAFAETPIATGAIDVENSVGTVEISASVAGHAKERMAVEAILEIRRSDTNGEIHTRQSKTVEVSAGETLSISSSGISLAAQGTLYIDLSIQHDEKIVHHVHHSIRHDIPK